MGLQKYDVAVLGAGIAGLMAARTLAAQGKKVALIEARSRIGGRIFSLPQQGPGLPVELGAEFIHGRPVEVWQLIEEAGLHAYEMDGTMLCFDENSLHECDKGPGGFDLMRRLIDNGPDQSFAEWLAQQDLPAPLAESAIAFVEGFNAADAARIGTAALARQQAAEDAIQGHLAFRLREGYSALPAFLLNQFQNHGGEIFLSAPAISVAWQRGNVRIHAMQQYQERVFEADQCIVTAPLGVLQAGSIHFDPSPSKTFHAASQIAMGNAKRITFLFRERFWQTKFPNAHFLFSQQDLMRVWWMPSPDPTSMLTGWIGGPKSLDASLLLDTDFAALGLRTLAKIFSVPEKHLRELLVSWHTHDWQRDPFSLGAYSYAPKGALEASEVMSIPVEDTLFFAGEHTDTTGHWGTVHGALRSGQRAARQVLMLDGPGKPIGSMPGFNTVRDPQ
jgi:monoamine oxidase